MEGVDYHDTFAPVAKLVTVRTLLTVAVKRDWIIHQLDVNNAFLHGDLNEEIYMKIPQGFSKEGETRVCRLRKSLYGLKQASRNWYHKFTTFLLSLNFKQSKADHSLFIYETTNTTVIALIYVDDVITGNCPNKIQEVKKQLDKEFSIKDLATLKYFLGIEVVKTKDGLVLSQRKYTLDILNDCGKLGCKPSTFPIEQGLKLDKGEHEATVDASQYCRLIGRLLYLQATRPDITYSVIVLSQFVADPRKSHLEAANRVLRYLKATPGGTPISWKSKKQSVVSQSSAEAEYKAMASTVSEVLWVRWLLSELRIDTSSPTPLFWLLSVCGGWLSGLRVVIVWWHNMELGAAQNGATRGSDVSRMDLQRRDNLRSPFWLHLGVLKALIDRCSHLIKWKHRNRPDEPFPQCPIPVILDCVIYSTSQELSNYCPFVSNVARASTIIRSSASAEDKRAG
nr:putative reverse transcriptase, RNA-dependent DNA polymerase, Gag-polypeptide of LTR copia-type [Tanacetum cinerariifolium]